MRRTKFRMHKIPSFESHRNTPPRNMTAPCGLPAGAEQLPPVWHVAGEEHRTNRVVARFELALAQWCFDALSPLAGGSSPLQLGGAAAES
jgi:hypothetical protein